MGIRSGSWISPAWWSQSPAEHSTWTAHYPPSYSYLLLVPYRGVSSCFLVGVGPIKHDGPMTGCWLSGSTCQVMLTAACTWSCQRILACYRFSHLGTIAGRQCAISNAAVVKLAPLSAWPITPMCVNSWDTAVVVLDFLVPDLLRPSLRTCKHPFVSGPVGHLMDMGLCDVPSICVPPQATDGGISYTFTDLFSLLCLSHCVEVSLFTLCSCHREWLAGMSCTTPCI